MIQAARRARADRAAPKIDIVVESDLWNRSDVKGIVKRAVAKAAALLSTPAAELAIVLSDDSAIRSLNRIWRGVDKATNVLSFPTTHASGEPALIGDIVLAYETIAGEARAQHKPFAHHVAHLVVHGFLHLVGFDHVDNAEAETMEQVERDVLRLLAIPDPYRPRARV